MSLGFKRLNEISKADCFWDRKFMTPSNFQSDLFCLLIVGADCYCYTWSYSTKERLTAGNKAFYANQKMFQNKLVSKKSKLKLYWTLIRPVVTYACETWVLKENIIQKLMIVERKILRKIFGPTKEVNGLWRIKTNEELDEPIKRKNIIRFIKSQRLKWLGHVERMPNEREVKNL